jgi:PST family polysaccharide transporter
LQEEHKQKTRIGFLWSAVMQFANHGASIIITILLARILSPDDFGLVAMVLAFTEFSRVLLNFGLGQALVQKETVLPIDYFSVFWMNLGIGFILSCTLYLASGAIADFYDEERLNLISKTLAITYIMASFGVVPQIKFVKDLNFKVLAQIRVLSVIVAGTIGIGLAMAGFGVWALVWIGIIRTFLISIFSLLKGKWLPQFRFSLASIRSIFTFSINLFANETLNYWMDNIDKLIIGKTIGDFSLGLYKQSYSFMMLPVNNIARVINSVLFPALSKVQHDRAYLGMVFLKSLRYSSLLVFPIMTGLFVVSETFVSLLLGEDWLQMVLVLKLFSIAGIFYTLAELTFSFFLAIGQAGKLFRVNLFARVLTLGCIVGGLRWGIEGVAFAILITSPVKLFSMLLVLSNNIQLKNRAIFALVTGCCGIAILAGGCGYFIHDNLLSGLPDILRLGAGILAVSITFAGGLFLFFRKSIDELLKQLRQIALRK